MSVVPSALSRRSAPAAGAASVVVSADRQLVRDVVSTALAACGLCTVSVPVPRSAAQILDMRRLLARNGARCGLLIAAADDVSKLRELSAVVAGVDLCWIVVAGTPSGPAWTALQRAGAHMVVPESIGLTDGGELLRRAAVGALVRDGGGEAPPHLRATRSSRIADSLARLSAREMEVLRQLAEGASVRAIASSTGVAESTVRTQVKSILRKLGATSQLKAVAMLNAADEWLVG